MEIGTIDFNRLKNRLIAKIITRFPSLAGRLTDAYTPWESEDIPWVPVKKRLRESKIAIVTTAGVHQKDQLPFDMKDKDGDPTFRPIDVTRPLSDLMITHDYYDHSDANKDINIIFPIERLREIEREGIIGRVADTHYGFMGHIDGRHIHTLISDSAPKVATLLRRDGIDAVLLTPG